MYVIMLYTLKLNSYLFITQSLRITKTKFFIIALLYSFIANLHRVRPNKISKRFHVIDLILLKQLFQIQLLFDSSLLPTNPCPGVNQET